ncbi:hypothetical protein SAMN05444166_7596 [Singulisphaera sp. GP187]|nr:hypothetical protein SAMN05444166_7596 [Singulisphaera sp. GP187]
MKTAAWDERIPERYPGKYACTYIYFGIAKDLPYKLRLF